MEREYVIFAKEQGLKPVLSEQPDKPSEEGVEEILKKFGGECASCARDTTNCCDGCNRLKKTESQLRQSIMKEAGK